ncbi:ABC transporter permease [Chloroflexus sp.]|uniref:ABC transporter permease n=1 Tax=Chloroflexus sp. TaxID=1904827 RepID=UPI002ACDCE2C|nr:ribose ABC transporter permease [Chloroflexus sp.]
MRSFPLSSDRFDRRTFGQRFGLALIFILLMLALALLSDRFLTPANLINILRQTAINGIISAGMTLVILTGGIDLSVGSVLALSVTIGAALMKQGWPVEISVLAALATGTGLGCINGVLITLARIPPFMATLGMLAMARGLTLMYTEGQPITGFPAAFRWLSTDDIAGILVPIVLMLLVFVAGGIILTARLWSAQPNTGIGLELDAIAAAVLGGSSLAGGAGGIPGTIAGSFIIGMLANGLNLLGVPSYHQQVIKWAIFVIAVVLTGGVGIGNKKRA